MVAVLPCFALALSLHPLDGVEAEYVEAGGEDGGRSLAEQKPAIVHLGAKSTHSVHVYSRWRGWRPLPRPAAAGHSSPRGKEYTFSTHVQQVARMEAVASEQQPTIVHLGVKNTNVVKKVQCCGYGIRLNLPDPDPR